MFLFDNHVKSEDAIFSYVANKLFILCMFDYCANIITFKFRLNNLLNSKAIQVVVI